MWRLHALLTSSPDRVWVSLLGFVDEVATAAKLHAEYRDHAVPLGAEPVSTRRTTPSGGFDGVERRHPPSVARWHFLYFLPLPQWQGSLRPGRGVRRVGALGMPISSEAS